MSYYFFLLIDIKIQFSLAFDESDKNESIFFLNNKILNIRYHTKILCLAVEASTEKFNVLSYSDKIIISIKSVHTGRLLRLAFEASDWLSPAVSPGRVTGIGLAYRIDIVR